MESELGRLRGQGDAEPAEAAPSPNEGEGRCVDGERS